MTPPPIPPDWRRTTAVFGGAFDPPHLGHRIAAQELFIHPGVKDVLILPTANPAFKNPICPTHHRLEMVRLNFQSFPNAPYPQEVRIDTREIDREARGSAGPSYTFDSLMEYRQIYPHLAFVVGTDQLFQMDRWYRFPEVLGLCHWIVLERRPDGPKVAGAALQKWVSGGVLKLHASGLWQIQGAKTFLQVVSTRAPSLASTEIREVFAKTGEISENLLFPPVANYLKQHRLYGMK